MKKTIGALLFFAVCSFNVQAQSGEVEQLVKEGIEQYDNGDYKAAIATYKKALKLDKESTLVNYEIAMAYFAQEDYEKAIEHSDVVIDAKADLIEESYIIKGSALDLLGKPKEAIKAYNKAIKDYPKSHLLCYNLGLTYYKMKDFKEAEDAVQKALKNNPEHASSHLLLGYMMSESGQRAKSLLALYNFLLLEPGGKRGATAFEVLMEETNKGVKKGDDNTINITLSDNGQSDDFMAAELMLSLLAASGDLEENKEKTEYELFTSNIESFFAVLGELGEDKNGFWWDFYVDFFYTMKNEGHVEAFSYYIAQSKEDTQIGTWLEANTAKFEAMSNWYAGYERKF